MSVKRVLSIGLIVIFLFNVIGYYGIYMAMLRQARVAFNEKIDKDEFKDDQTMTIKIPLSLPYPVQQDNFERVQGDFEHQGEFYKLVKQKYSNDTLYVVCVKSAEEKKAFKVLSDFVKLSTDQSSAPNNQNVKTIASLIKDYNPSTALISISNRESIELKKTFSFERFSLLSQESPAFTPPPEKGC